MELSAFYAEYFGKLLSKDGQSIFFCKLMVNICVKFTGVPSMSSVDPSQLSTFSDRMTFLQRLINMFAFIVKYSVGPKFLSIQDSSKYVPEKPVVSVDYLVSHSDLVLANLENNCFDYPRLSAPHFKYISGASAAPPQPLPEKFELFVNQAPDGVIVVTFGSLHFLLRVVALFVEELLEGFGQLKQNVIFVYNKQELIDRNIKIPKNVMIEKWIPQNDLLGEYVLVFIKKSGDVTSGIERS